MTCGSFACYCFVARSCGTYRFSTDLLSVKYCFGKTKGYAINTQNKQPCPLYGGVVTHADRMILVRTNVRVFFRLIAHVAVYTVRALDSSIGRRTAKRKIVLGAGKNNYYNNKKCLKILNHDVLPTPSAIISPCNLSADLSQCTFLYNSPTFSR